MSLFELQSTVLSRGLLKPSLEEGESPWTLTQLRHFVETGGGAHFMSPLHSIEMETSIGRCKLPFPEGVLATHHYAAPDIPSLNGIRPTWVEVSGFVGAWSSFNCYMEHTGRDVNGAPVYCSTENTSGGRSYRVSSVDSEDEYDSDHSYTPMRRMSSDHTRFLLDDFYDSDDYDRHHAFGDHIHDHAVTWLSRGENGDWYLSKSTGKQDCDHLEGSSSRSLKLPIESS